MMAYKNHQFRRKCPDDFDATFVRIGRLACEEHYHAARGTVGRWLEERDRDRLTAGRAAFVRAKRQTITRKDIRTALETAYPVFVNPNLVRRAAHYLRIRRNGGWIVSPAGNGLWWVGSRRRTAAELIELAKNAGFDTNLSRLDEAG